MAFVPYEYEEKKSQDISHRSRRGSRILPRMMGLKTKTNRSRD